MVEVFQKKPILGLRGFNSFGGLCVFDFKKQLLVSESVQKEDLSCWMIS